jgi:hypothetical protein
VKFFTSFQYPTGSNQFKSMTTKNVMHYTGMQTRDTDETEIDSPSTNIDVYPQPAVPEMPTTIEYRQRLKRNTWLSVIFFFALGATSILVIAPSYNQSKEDSSIKTDAFDRSQLYTSSHSSNSSSSSDGTFCVGCSKYPAILLYRYYSRDVFSTNNMDDIYGHIPHQWINSEASFLLVDQITKGVGMSSIID